MATEKCKICGALLTGKEKFCPECGIQIAQIKQDEQPENAAVTEPLYEAPAGIKPEENGSTVIYEKSGKAEHSDNGSEKIGENQYQNQTAQQKNNYTGTKEQFNPYITPPPPDSKYAVTGMWNFVGMMILFSLPVIGFIFVIVWACDSNNINRSNYARAVLILIAVSILLGIIMIVVGVVLYYNVIVEIIQRYSGKNYIFPFNDYNIQIDKFINSMKFNSGAFICRHIGDITAL